MSGSNSQQNGFIVDMSKWNLNDPLQSVDPEIYGLIKDEKDRQRKGLEMIASENFTYTAILDCLGSCLHNKYSEGQPGASLVMGSGVKSRVRVGFGCHPLGFGSGSGVGPRVPFGFRVFSGFKK